MVMCEEISEHLSLASKRTYSMMDFLLKAKGEPTGFDPEVLLVEKFEVRKGNAMKTLSYLSPL